MREGSSSQPQTRQARRQCRDKGGELVRYFDMSWWHSQFENARVEDSANDEYLVVYDGEVEPVEELTIISI